MMKPGLPAMNASADGWPGFVMGAWLKRLGPVFALLVVLLAFPGSASAHAIPVDSDPPSGSVAPTAPTIVKITFSESPDPGFSHIEVFDASGRRVDQGDSRLDPNDTGSLIVSLSAPLPDGIYTAAWRALSNVDGHVTQGAFSFGVGNVAAPAATAQPAAGTPPAMLLAESVARWLNLLAAMLAAGGSLFRWLIWRPAWRAAFPLQESRGDMDPALLADKRIAWATAALLVLGLLALLFVQGVAVGGGTLSAGVDPAQLVRLVTGSRFGALWLARLALTFALMLTLRAGYGRRAEGARIALAALLLFTGALASHAAAQPDPLLPLLNDFVHLAAAAVWGGALVHLVLSLRAASPGLDLPARTRLAAGAVSRFSALGLTAVGVLVLTGVVQTALQMSGMDFALLFGADSLLLTTDYGRALLVKLVLVVPLIGTAGFNLLIAGPRLRAGSDDAARKLLSRSVPLEIVLLSAVLLTVGVLTSLQPARQPGTEGLAFTGKADDLSVRVAITPGRTGMNQFDVTLTDAQGAPYDDAKAVTLRFQPLGGATVGMTTADLRPQGHGHYTASGLYLSLAGRWAIELAVRRPDAFDAFAQFQADVEGAVALTTPEPGGQTVTPVDVNTGNTDPPAPATDTTTADNLQLVVAGIASPFISGDAVPLDGDVLARVTWQPGDERVSRMVDLYLFHQDSGEPVRDAAVQATATMRYMEHGTFSETALSAGDGHYLLPLQFTMPGEWQLELQITRDGAPQTIDFDIDLFE
jgi:copper transport protein